MAIITMTTIPPRINKIEKTIKSLLMQKADIYVWIPKVFKRTGERFSGVIPDFLKHERIKLNVVEDQGSITKLLPALNLDEEILITADDDIYYPVGWIDGLLKANEKYPQHALCYRGRTFKDRNIREYRRTSVLNGANYEFVDIITGVRGALYNKSFFTKEIYEYKNLKPAYYVDDIWISGCLDNNGVRRMCIPNMQAVPVKGVVDIEPLFEINSWRSANNNDIVINNFKWKHI